MINIIQKRKVFFALSGSLLVLSIVALSVWGLKVGIDFKGGSLLEVAYEGNRPGVAEVEAQLADESLNLGSVVVQPSGDSDVIIRMRNLSENEHQAVIEKLRAEHEGGSVVENRFESVGPVIGQELASKAWQAIIIALIVIILYMAYAFRKVSKPVASWKYGISAIVALAHDILLVTGVFAVLGYFMNIEVGILFVTALLTVLGYSVNDTIVVFDRVRENLIHRPKETFEETINHSVNETITRSVNTSLTTLLVLTSLFFFGGASIREFVLVLILGAVFGTYSSIFIASPLLVVWQKIGKRK